MVLFAIILMTVGMLVLPIGRLYVAWQRHRENPKYANSEFVKRFMSIRWVVSISLCVAAISILLIMQY